MKRKTITFDLEHFRSATKHLDYDELGMLWDMIARLTSESACWQQVYEDDNTTSAVKIAFDMIAFKFNDVGD